MKLWLLYHFRSLRALVLWVFLACSFAGTAGAVRPLIEVPLFQYFAWSNRYGNYTQVAQETAQLWVMGADGPEIALGFAYTASQTPWWMDGWNFSLYPVIVYIGVLPEMDFGATQAEVDAFNLLVARLNRTIDVLNTSVPDEPSDLPGEPPETETLTDILLGGDSTDCPMMTYSAHAKSVSLRIQDSPLTYVPSFGPVLGPTIYYTDGGSASGGAAATNGGWRHSLDSWLEDDPTNPAASIRLFPRGGGAETFADYVVSEEKFQGNRWANSTLHRMPAGSYPAGHYERRFTDGSVEIYGLSDGAAVGPRRWFLKEFRDAQSNALTFQYDGTKLISCTDAAGKVTTLVYDATFPQRLWKLVDPFGRTAVLGYDGSGRLTSCTDPVGVRSEVTYGADGEVDSLSTPYGHSTFSRGAIVEGGVTVGKWLEMRDPKNALERIETRFDQPRPSLTTVGGIQFLDPQAVRSASTLSHWAALDPSSRTLPASGWIAAGLLPEAGVTRIGPFGGTWNRQLHSADQLGARGATTYFWDKKAAMGVPLQKTNAAQIGWAFGPRGTSGFPAWSKAPLEATVAVVYEGQTKPGYAVNGRVIESYRSADGVVKKQNIKAEYSNPLGLRTKAVDAIGRTTEIVYDPVNPVDAIEIRNTTLHNGTQHNDLLISFSNYEKHQPQVVTDAAGKQTLIDYNARGQVKTVTNSKSEVTKYVYDETPANPEFGRLLTVTRAFGTGLAATTTYAYDAYGRVESVTDSENYVVSLAYDAIGEEPLKSIDRVIRVTFPDSTYRETRYDDIRWPLDIAHSRDRLGRETAFEYDQLRNQVKVTAPGNRVTQFVQCPCGAMDKIIDPRNNEIEWTRDLQKRITGKKITGQTVATYAYEPDTGRLSTVTDALGQITTYSYYLDDRIQGITYDSTAQPTKPPTPSVTFIYDPAFPRLTKMTDGTGETNYAYVPIDPSDAILGDGQLETVDGPLVNDTIAYEFDELGRTTDRSINGAANASEVSYDALGRVSVVINPLGQFDPIYVNKTGRLDHVAWPNGQRTNFGWKPNAEDQRLESITHLDPTPQIQSQHTYGYDTEGKIQTWQSAVAGSTKKYTFGYNASDELEDAVQRAEPSQALLHAFRYGYDLSGNRITSLEDSKFASTPANNKNQLTGSSGSGSLLFRGTVNEPSSVTLAGQAATVTGLEWKGFANVTAGLNSIELKATETTVAPGFNAQTTTRHIELTLTADADRTFAYDDNGNMTDNGATQTYEWDAANRLVAINYTGTALRTEFTYDGLSRWVKIVEKNGESVLSTKQFVWEGYSIAEERDGLNNITRNYFAEGERRGALKLYYSRDHLGSVREVTDETGGLRARYDYEVWGKRTKIAGDLDCDFGFTGHYQQAQSGLIVAPLRFYSVDLARWLSQDPIGEEEGLNLYRYVGNDPINAIDPLGLAELYLNYGLVVESVLRGTFAADLVSVVNEEVLRPMGLPLEALPPLAGEASLLRCPPKSGGRLGSLLTRQHVADVAKEMEARGWTITHGGGRFPEEFLPGPGGRTKGASYPDITAVKDGKTLRVNTVDTRADGKTPTKRESANAKRIREQTGEHLLLVPKPK